MKLFNVIPNIFVALDSKGMPCGFTFADPTIKNTPKFRVVGGVLTKEVPKEEKERVRSAPPEDIRETRVLVGSRISLVRPSPVEPTEYHRARILSGEMIAADIETAAECGISAKNFRSPVEILEATRNARIAEWNAEHGGENPVCEGLEIRPSDKGGVLIQWSEAARAKAEGRAVPKAAPAKAADKGAAPQNASLPALPAAPTAPAADSETETA
jgi:hypothetical protein